MAEEYLFNTNLTSAEARAFAKSQSDPVACLIDVLALLRHFERAGLLDYGEEAHRFMIENRQGSYHNGVAQWARQTPDPVSELGEFVWVLNQFERASRLVYGTPPHANALDYAQARWQAAMDMAGLESLEPGA